MKILTRYILTQTMGTLAITVAAISALLLVSFVVKEAITEGLGALEVAQLIPYLLPNALLFAVPGGALLAVCQVYGRMAGANEIAALKGLGVHPLTIVWPTLALMTLLSFATVWLNDVAMSWGYLGAQRVLLGAIENIAYRTLETRKSFTSRAFTAHVSRVDGRQLIRPTFTFQLADDLPVSTVTAATGSLRADLSAGVLTISLFDGHVETGSTRFRFPGALDFEVSLDRVSRKGTSGQSPAHLSLAEIPVRVQQQKVAVERLQQDRTAVAALALLTGNIEPLGDANWTPWTQRLKEEQGQLGRLQFEPPRRWANGFSCLGFALVGIPIAIRMRSSEVLTSFFVCFLPILLAYYPLIAVATDRCKSGTWPNLAIWGANAVLAVISVRLFRHVIRY